MTNTHFLSIYSKSLLSKITWNGISDPYRIHLWGGFFDKFEIRLPTFFLPRSGCCPIQCHLFLIDGNRRCFIGLIDPDPQVPVGKEVVTQHRYQARKRPLELRPVLQVLLNQNADYLMTPSVTEWIFEYQAID